MKKVHYDRLLSALAVLLWMAVIYIFSAQTGAVSGDTSGRIVKLVVGFFYPNFNSLSPDLQTEIMTAWHTVIRKGAHFSEYAVLAVLSANAIRTYNLSKLWRVVITLAISFLYAASDEIHQLFVANRAGSFTDVLIDTSGAVFGLAIFVLARFLIAKKRENIKKGEKI